ncbi:hypothetical protein EVAR_19757_1 [Eumeta japonica]|uniref:Uncharacterized protein n=1 Tax=Eumeta variegata TaxID=151549 RepID=A0A4C1URW5_EUMVA|nr:hypothetical protein EVAR_19757_1 [Eumeta japonica]
MKTTNILIKVSSKDGRLREALEQRKKKGINQIVTFYKQSERENMLLFVDTETATGRDHTVTKIDLTYTKCRETADGCSFTGFEPRRMNIKIEPQTTPKIPRRPTTDHTHSDKQQNAIAQYASSYILRRSLQAGRLSLSPARLRKRVSDLGKLRCVNFLLVLTPSQVLRFEFSIFKVDLYEDSGYASVNSKNRLCVCMFCHHFEPRGIAIDYTFACEISRFLTEIQGCTKLNRASAVTRERGRNNFDGPANWRAGGPGPFNKNPRSTHLFQ